MAPAPASFLAPSWVTSEGTVKYIPETITQLPTLRSAYMFNSFSFNSGWESFRQYDCF